MRLRAACLPRFPFSRAWREKNASGRRRRGRRRRSAGVRRLANDRDPFSALIATRNTRVYGSVLDRCDCLGGHAFCVARFSPRTSWKNPRERAFFHSAFSTSDRCSTTVRERSRLFFSIADLSFLLDLLKFRKKFYDTSEKVIER